MMKKQIKIIISLLSILFVIGIGILFYFQSQIAPLHSNLKLQYEVKQGASIQSVLKDLETEKIIKNADIALYYAKFKKTRIISGKFNLSSNQSVDEILAIISSSNNLVHDEIQVTLVEGKWAIHYAEILEKNLSISKEKWIEKWNDKEYLKTLKNKYFFIDDNMLEKDVKVLLEGYLAPDTYQFLKDSTVEQVTEKILDNTLLRLSPYQNQSTNIQEILTRASIVQYEASNYEDMQKIAHIIQSRLEKNMKLEMSVTVCYSLYEKLDDWKNCETQLDVDSKYNTYKNRGLPIGPIANPSQKAIEAVFNPTKTEDLFFVADVCGDGKIYFSKTFEEHDLKVKKYLKDTRCLP